MGLTLTASLALLAVAPAANAQLPTVPNLPVVGTVPAVQLPALELTNGLINLDGLTVRADLGNGSLANAEIAANGRDIPLVNGVVQDVLVRAEVLNGREVLRLQIGNGQVITIPLTSSILGPGGLASGVIPPTVLNALRGAGVGLVTPPDGFAILDGQPLTIEGRVANRDALADLKVNGQSVLGVLKDDPKTANPNDGTFTTQVPASSIRNGADGGSGSNGSNGSGSNGADGAVTITATVKQGVSQTSSFGVKELSSLIATPAGRSVSALGARGLRVASVRYITKGVAKTKRIKMIVTVRDTRGLLVRDAIIRIRARSFNFRRVIGGQQARTSGKLGTATFTLRLNAKLFTKGKQRLFTSAVAVTPTKKVTRNTSVSVPRLAKARTRR